jgi:prepilin-type N-terminal cleavage/methylation domain-containing protein
MSKSRLPNRDSTGRRALTLIEVLVALSILALAVTGLQTSFSTGIRAFRTSEEGLDRIQELRSFLTFLGGELENMTPYLPVPFEGKAKEIVFPAVARRYDEQGYEEAVYLIRYTIESNRIVREEERLRKKEGGSAEKRKFVVLENIRQAAFDFPYKDKETAGVLWRDLWDKESGQGLPRAVRLTMQVLPRKPERAGADKAAETSETTVPFESVFSIPQGSWGVVQ